MDMSKLADVRTIDQLANKLRTDPELAADFAADAPSILDAVAANRIPNNQVYRIVVGSLGGALMISLIGAIYLSTSDTQSNVPDILVSAASAAVGALAGLLAPQPQ